MPFRNRKIVIEKSEASQDVKISMGEASHNYLWLSNEEYTALKKLMVEEHEKDLAEFIARKTPSEA